MTIALKPMSEFDPSQPSMVHDVLNNKTFPWKPEEYLQSYRRSAETDGSGLIAWDGMLLDGWTEHISL
jgi:hypothetical protein